MPANEDNTDDSEQVSMLTPAIDTDGTEAIVDIHQEHSRLVAREDNIDDQQVLVHRDVDGSIIIEMVMKDSDELHFRSVTPAGGHASRTGE
jgi:hypothetical protein